MKTCKHIFTILVFFISSLAFAEDHVIYAVEQDIPMGYENEVIKKNFYINMGSTQGLQKGNILTVYRTISKLNPYNNQSRINYNIKIGEVEVLHVEENAAVTQLKKMENTNKTPLFDVNGFMIGDKVGVSVN